MREPKSEPIKELVTLTVCIVVVWGIYWVVMLYLVPNWSDRGLFGDMFGSVNALFSGLALAGVIYAIFLQRRELQLQRHELELTRNELQRSAAAQEKSEQALREQIKQMQEQSELQLLPFVVLMKDTASGHNKYLFWNAGNGTAINVKISIVTGCPNEYDINTYSTKTSILTKGQKDFIDDTNPAVLENKNFHIEFENINKKSYFVSGKLENGKTEIIEFGRYKS